MQLRGSSSTGVLCICNPLHFLGPLFAGLLLGAFGGVAVVVAGVGPKPPSRELSPVLPRHVKPCGELWIGRPARLRNKNALKWLIMV